MANSQPVVDWFGPVFSKSGYGRHARELALELKDRPVDIAVEHRGVRHDMDLPQKQQNKLNVMENKPRRNRYNPDIERGAIEVWVLNPAHALCEMRESIWDPEVYTILLTVYEAEEIPQPWVSISNEFDEIWVPAEFARQSFENAGVKNDFYVMPEGADLNRFSPRGDQLYDQDGFTLLSVFDFTYRKGWDKLLHSFGMEFSEFENVNLILHTHYSRNTSEDRQMVKKRIDSILDQHNCPDYTLSFGYIDEDKFPSLYRSADCFALTTRGEGFGLPLFEAAASDVSVLTTNYGAPPEYLDDSVYWVETNGTKPYPFEEAAQHEPNCAGLEFGEPSIHSTREQMRQAYQDWQSGDLESPDISNVTWEVGATKIINRLRSIWKNHY